MAKKKKVITIHIVNEFNDDGTFQQEITVNADNQLQVFEAIPLLEAAITNLRNGYAQHLNSQ